MELKEYANGLSPYISSGLKGANYFVAIVGNYIKDSAMDSCVLLHRKPDTQYRYLTGRPIQPEDAQYLYDQKDPQKYAAWILDRMDASESFDSVCDWLKQSGKPGEYPEEECTDLLTEIILSVCSTNTEQKKTPSQFEESLELINDINSKIRILPRPTNVPVPSVATENEQTYIRELMNAYGDAENISDFTDIELVSYPEYKC